MNSSIQRAPLTLIKIVIILFSAHASLCNAINPDILNCNAPAVQFEEGFMAWEIEDLKGSSVVWRECSELENLTGESGKSLCVTPMGLDYDTTVQSASFSLKGAITAEARLRLYYRDAELFKDRVQIEIKVGGGLWTPLWFEENIDWGPAGGPGVELILNLAPYVGNDSVSMRVRYRDQSNSGTGEEVQIDNIRLLCTGGANLAVNATSSTLTAIEGDIVEYDMIVTNNGSGSATDLIASMLFPAPFSLLSVSGIPLGSNEMSGAREFAFGPPAPLANASSIGPVTAEVRVAMYPEVQFQVQSPAFLAGEYAAVGATFGSQISDTEPMTGTLVLAIDGAGGNIYDGCEPLTNAANVVGQIVLLHNPVCDEDIAVKNAQDAGAIAAIVGASDHSPISAVQYPDSSLPPLKLSGSVLEPITIPSIRISSNASEILRLNIASAVQIRMRGVDVLEQRLTVFGYTFAEEFDPDFHPFKIVTASFSESDNFSLPTIRVLRDRDQDGTADINDDCINDSGKSDPGICGCGVVDVDADGNGTIDCLEAENPEDIAALNAKNTISLSTGELLAALQKLRASKPGASQKQKKKAKSARKLLRERLADLEQKVAMHGALVVLSNPADDLNILFDATRRGVKKALRIKSPKFKALKRKGKKAVVKLQSALA